MKTSIKSLLIGIAFAAAFVSCKNNNAEMGSGTENIETMPDNSAVPETQPPVTDTVPGVESGVGDEQIP